LHHPEAVPTRMRIASQLARAYLCNDMADSTETYAVVYITASSLAEARQLADTLVGERLAACVSILPAVRSVYRWQGKREEAEESLLMCKTTTELFPRLEQRVREEHSYDVPEIILVPIMAASAPYLRWMDETLGTTARESGSASPRE